MNLRQLQLANRLHKLRKQAGVPLDQVAALLECSSPRIGHFESGRNPPKRPELPAMLQLYGALDQLEELEALRLSAMERGWWATAGLPKWAQDYLGLESDAVMVRSFALELVPGLLQTQDYAKEAHRAQDDYGDDTDRMVAARMTRQQLMDTRGTEVVAVLSEGVLHRTLHMGDVGAVQLRHLAEISTRPGTSIYVLPWSAGRHRSMSGSFNILSFPSGTVDPVVYRMYSIGGDLVDDSQLVHQHEEIFSDLIKQALLTSESTTVLSAFIDQKEVK